VIRDNGIGFNANEVPHLGWGLVAMREQALAAGGHLYIESAPGKGTEIRIEILRETMKISIFLADDHTVLREGLKYILESQNDIIVVGEAADGLTAVKMIQDLKPDVVIMDISMPKLNGIEATRMLNEVHSSAKVVILSIHATSEHIHRALRSGAKGYVLKESASKELIEAVRKVHAGGRFLSEKIVNTVIDNFIFDEKSVTGKSPLETLSQRERQVMQLVVEGRTSPEISKIIFISTKTVETYRSRIMQKLKVNDTISLVKFAIRHGMISTD